MAGNIELTILNYPKAGIVKLKKVFSIAFWFLLNFDLFNFQFNKHIKKAEGQKPPKVELTISADGVTIQDPKTKVRKNSFFLPCFRF